MRIKGVKQVFLYVATIGFSIFLLFFFVCCSWIGYEVKNMCQEAKGDYGGDCVEALVKLLGDESKEFRSRNDAIWALGQLGDGRALPVLQSYYTGNIPLKESLTKTISQYELKKAVNLAGGGLNITAIFWRYNTNN